ncbi:DUF6126 family protein [Streptomyces sp. H27-C3]|uniref:DUF6126 family protein n=1 Tax=Streptomyces sp. H27-C3 TaxID=3046305 RepID=UPI0024B9758D|nr:DUF6126 family protein [Streptomyces sp. H27-C3]MDJ0465682.1 DUF6126 family protein [Streptomyces sp. H27-C3]
MPDDMIDEKAVGEEAGARPAKRSIVEDKFPRGLMIRLFVYVVAGHLFAAFVYLLFTLGAER